LPRAEQARAALAAATAKAAEADADQRRVRALFQEHVASQQEFDNVDARAKAARAQVAQAGDALTEVQVLLGETTVVAPFDGVVADRRVDPGDMAGPGQPVIVIHDPSSLRIEAHVSEGCAGAIGMGMEVPVRFDAPPRVFVVRIEEVAPGADPQSRTLLIKAGLPPAPDLRPGAFGTVQTPCGKHDALLIPSVAVTRTGQLETVRVVADGAMQTRHVRTGKRYGDYAEVLSGLREGEKIFVEADGAPKPDA
jgi:RND family efflux transporter MFP subunit